MIENEFDQAFALAFSPDAGTLAVGLIGGRIDLWSIGWQAPIQVHRLTPAGSLHHNNQNLAIVALSFAQDGSRLYVANSDGVYEMPLGTQSWIKLANGRLLPQEP